MHYRRITSTIIGALLTLPTIAAPPKQHGGPDLLVDENALEASFKHFVEEVEDLEHRYPSSPQIPTPTTSEASTEIIATIGATPTTDDFSAPINFGHGPVVVGQGYTHNGVPSAEPTNTVVVEIIATTFLTSPTSSTTAVPTTTLATDPNTIPFQPHHFGHGPVVQGKGWGGNQNQTASVNAATHV